MKILALILIMLAGLPGAAFGGQVSKKTTENNEAIKASEDIFKLSCEQPSQNLLYKVKFHKDNESRFVQEIYDINQRIENQYHILELFKFENNTITYKKQGNVFSIDVASGDVKKNGKKVPIVCYFYDRENDLEKYTTTRPSNEILFKIVTNHYSDPIRAIGTLASTEKLCQIFNHKFFSYNVTDYNLFDTMNSNFRWDGIEAGSLWIQQELAKQSLIVDRFSLEREIHIAADRRLVECLTEITYSKPVIYEKIRRFLVYLGGDCHKPTFKIKKSVDDKGNILEEKIPYRDEYCVNFNYNSGYYYDWNSTTFLALLLWEEAHPVLLSILDKGEIQLAEKIEHRARMVAENQRIEEERKKENERRKRRIYEQNQIWEKYQSREKSLMESVYNFASTGIIEGNKSNYWIEESRCVMINGKIKIDNRQLNMTAFRVFMEFIGTTWYRVSTDSKFRLTTSADIPLDRLQKAWTLAFEECPGKRSRF